MYLHPERRTKIPVASLRPQPPRKHCRNKGKMDAKRSETGKEGNESRSICANKFEARRLSAGG